MHVRERGRETDRQTRLSAYRVEKTATSVDSLTELCPAIYARSIRDFPEIWPRFDGELCEILPKLI